MNIERSAGSEESYLHERLTKASGYFLPLVKSVQEACGDTLGLEIDNKETKKKVNETLEELLTALDIIVRSLEGFENGDFSIDRL